MLVGRLDHFVVPYAAARFDDRFDTGCRCGIDGVAEREERFTGHGRTRNIQLHLFRFFKGALGRIDAAGHSHPDGDKRTVLDVGDAVGLGARRDLVGDLQVFHHRRIGGKFPFLLRVFDFVFPDDIRILENKPAQDVFEIILVIRCDQQAVFAQGKELEAFFRFEHFQCRRFEVRRDDHFQKDLVHLFRHLFCHGPVDRDNAAERGDRVAFKRFDVGVVEVSFDGTAAWVPVLDDRDTGVFSEACGDLDGTGDVCQVVEARLPFNDAEVFGVEVIELVEGPFLVRVLPVSEGLHQVPGDKLRFAGVVKTSAHVCGDHAVVCGCMLVRFDHQAAAELEAVGAVFKGLDNRCEVAVAGDDQDVLEVLGRTSDHGRTADVDIFDDFGEVVGSLDRCFERVEVDTDQVDGTDAVLFDRIDVGFVVADMKDPAVNHRVEGLDPAVEHLGKVGDRGDVDGGDAGILEGFESTAGTDDFEIEFNQVFGELYDSRLVADGEQCAFHIAYS